MKPKSNITIKMGDNRSKDQSDSDIESMAALQDKGTEICCSFSRQKQFYEIG